MEVKQFEYYRLKLHVLDFILLLSLKETLALAWIYSILFAFLFILLIDFWAEYFLLFSSVFVDALFSSEHELNEKTDSKIIIFFILKFYTPVLPKPLSPLTEPSNLSTASHSIVWCLAIIICAIRSPVLISKSESDKFIRITPISPR